MGSSEHLVPSEQGAPQYCVFLKSAVLLRIAFPSELSPLRSWFPSGQHSLGQDSLRAVPFKIGLPSPAFSSAKHFCYTGFSLEQCSLEQAPQNNADFRT
jgi:hypothetical protein